MIIDPKTIEKKDVYKLLTGAIVPRPIAWVSSVSQEGVYNLAPFSFFTVASRNPPTLCISIGPGIGEREGTMKDTLRNAMDTGELVINVVSLSLGKQMQESSGNFQPEVDEFKKVGVTPVECVSVSPPRVLEAPISMECKVDQIIPVGTDHLVLARLVTYHIRDDIYMEGNKVDLLKLEPIGRLAGSYAKVNTIFEL
jgi:flavin reductase (DIM6/NTAB) family NADH-FMN oxidoreductase RutF